MFFWRLWAFIKSWFASSRFHLGSGPVKFVTKTAVKVNPVAGDIPATVQGFGPFARPASSAEHRLQKAAVNDLFDRLGVEWIPPEYWEELAVHPDPIEALRAFCRKYGLKDGQIGAGDTKETARFRLVVGILLDLGQIKDALGADEIDQLREVIVQRRYSEVEARTRICRKTLDVIRRVEEADLPYRNFKDFRAAVTAYRGHLFTFEEKDADQANEVLEQFLTFHTDFQTVIEACDQRIAYLLHHWPTDYWATDNRPVRDGMIAAKEQVEQDAVEREFQPDDVLATLAQIRDDLHALIDELQAMTGDKWSDPAPHSPDRTAMSEWERALGILGFAPDAEPTSAQIMKVYRKMVMKWHPDKHPGNPDAAEKFRSAVEARTILERGKPRT